MEQIRHLGDGDINAARAVLAGGFRIELRGAPAGELLAHEGEDHRDRKPRQKLLLLAHAPLSDQGRNRRSGDPLAMTAVNTTGTARVSCCIADTLWGALATITLGASATSSAAFFRMVSTPQR